MLPESERIKNAIKKVCDEEINAVTAPCFRIYKGKITSAPSNGKCGVCLVGDTKAFSLPYASEVADLPVNSLVWIAVPYNTENSISNGVVWRDVAFKKPDNVMKTYYGTVSTTQGIIALPIDTTKHTITQFNLVNLDFNAGSIGETASYVYAAGFFYKLGQIASASMTSGTTTYITVATSSSDVWYANTNIKITVNYV